MFLIKASGLLKIPKYVIHGYIYCYDQQLCNHNALKIFIAFYLFVLDFTSLWNSIKRVRYFFLILFHFCYKSLSKKSTDKKLQIKTYENSDSEFVTNFLPRWTPIKGDTSEKELNSAQLQTIAYLSWNFYSYLSPKVFEIISAQK